MYFHDSSFIFVPSGVMSPTQCLFKHPTNNKIQKLQYYMKVKP